MKSASMPVTPITGQSALTRMRQGASSTASDFETRFTAPFEALYHVSPGRGRMPAVDPTFSITPPPLSRISGTTERTMWKIDFTLTAKIRSKVASSTSRIGRLRCVTPALLTTMSGTPKALDRARRPPRRHVVARRDVRLDGNRPVADRVDDPARLIASRMSTDRHPRALRGEPPGHPFAEPAARAGDERDLSTAVVPRAPSAVIDDDGLEA